MDEWNEIAMEVWEGVQRMKFHMFYMMAGHYTREVEVKNSYCLPTLLPRPA